MPFTLKVHDVLSFVLASLKTAEQIQDTLCIRSKNGSSQTGRRKRKTSSHPWPNFPGERQRRAPRPLGTGPTAVSMSSSWL